MAGYLTQAALAVESWADFKREAAWQMADDIIDEYDLTLADLEQIKTYQSIGTDDDMEIIYWIEEELKSRGNANG